MIDVTEPLKKPVFSLHQRPREFFFLCILVLVATQAEDIRNAFHYLNVTHADSSLRLAVVRALLEGQSWFDMTMYRILPPEGLSLHWSRYVDAPIAAVILAFKPLFGMAAAERIAVTVYPLMLAIAYLAVVASACCHLWGKRGAVFGMMGVVTTPIITRGYFGIGDIDHHNVQILLITILFTALFARRRVMLLAMVSGFAGALSIAVGFEGLPMAALAGLLCAIRFWRLEEQAPKRLGAFGAGLGLGAVLFFFGQTNPKEWQVAYCDYLSYPWVGLCLGAAGWSLMTARFAGRYEDKLKRFGFSIAFAVPFGLFIIWVLAPCYAGPYTHLSDELMTGVIKKISESLPLLTILEDDLRGAVTLMGPFHFSTALLFFGLAKARLTGKFAAGTRQADTDLRTLELTLVFCGVLALMFIQLRAVVLGIGLFPIIMAGACETVMERIRFSSKTLQFIARVVLVGSTMGSVWSFGSIVARAPHAMLDSIKFNSQIARLFNSANISSEPGTNELACYLPKTLTVLNQLAPGRILSSMNLGPSIIVHTHHDALMGAYHRSAESVYNGSLALWGDAARLKSTLDRSKADYFILCRAFQDDSQKMFVQTLFDPKTVLPAWLKKEEISNETLLVFSLFR